MRTKLILLILLTFSLQQLQGQSQTVGLYFNDSLAYNGYTLFSPLTYNITYLIDNCGYEVNSWESNQIAGQMGYLLDDGTLLRSGVIQSPHFAGGGAGGIIERFNWDGELIWDLEYHSEFYHQHHDLEPMPNGNFLMIVWYKYSVDEAIARGKDPEMLEEELWIDRILEVKPLENNEAEIVWEWNAWDHMIQDFDESKENYGVVADHPEKIDVNYTDQDNHAGRTDWIHTNTVSYNAELDQIMLTVRQYSEVWIIDHSTSTEEAKGSTGGIFGKGGDLLYRWGNPEAYDRGNEEDQKLRYMHDAHWIPDGSPGEGQIIVFNNDHIENDQSGVVVFNPPEDDPGFYSDPGTNAYGPDTVNWIYEDEFLYSRVVSGAQRLPNGNTLICEGQGGNFYEVSLEEKEEVWKYRCPVGILGPITQGQPPFGVSVFKVRRYSSSYKAFEGKDMSPGEPVELEPWEYDCTIYEDTSSSAIYEFAEWGRIKMANPFGDHLSVVFEKQGERHISIFNMQSKAMAEIELHTNALQVETGSWPDGIYIMRVIDREMRIVKSFSLLKSGN